MTTIKYIFFCFHLKTVSTINNQFFISLIVYLFTHFCMAIFIGVDSAGAGGRRPPGSDTEGGEICLAPSVFVKCCTDKLK